MPEPRCRIARVFFLVHPCCWSMHGGGPPSGYRAQYGVPLSHWYTALNWERRVNQLQKEFINRMRADEVLVVYPIGDSPAMRDLEDHAAQTLDRRCIVLKSPICPEPAALHATDEPIQRFLEDEQLEGRQAFWEAIPPHLRAEVEQEIRQTCRRHGYSWSPSALKVIAGNRVYAAEIAAELEARGLEVDPSAVRATAFGEGFEQCAMTWKAMAPHYLGWTHPIENDFDLSVSGAPVLFDATLKERVSLDRDIRLFLWEKAHGLPMALLARARVRLADPHYAVEVSLAGHAFEARDVSGAVLWPGPDAALSAAQGRLRVPVLSGIRKYAEHTCYLIGCNTSYDQFRDLLLRAAIVETPCVP